MQYREITVNTTRVGSDLVANVLYELGSEGVSIFDTDDLADILKSDIQWDYVEEHLLQHNDVVKVKGYFNAEDNTIIKRVIDALSSLKANSELNLGSLEEVSSIINEEDWVNEWRKYYKPIHVNDVVIVPSWIKYDATANEKIVRLEPGMAFGTGTHESTHMCIELLTMLDPTDKVVLDVGTGSGILGITAGVMGASEVYMYDIDDIAVKAARENIALNNLQDKVHADNSNLLSTNSKRADIVLANITADILIMLSSDLADNLNDSAKIILSGIIKSRCNDVVTAYSKKGYKIVKLIEDGEWNALLMER